MSTAGNRSPSHRVEPPPPGPAHAARPAASPAAWLAVIAALAAVTGAVAAAVALSRTEPAVSGPTSAQSMTPRATTTAVVPDGNRAT